MFCNPVCELGSCCGRSWRLFATMIEFPADVMLIVSGKSEEASLCLMAVSIKICNAIGAHHDEVEMTSLLSPIVQVCDAISGARPGARREVAESYINRIKKLEEIAFEFEGVVKTYAIQAGRELRVIVGSDKVTDKEVDTLSYNIARKIQEEMTYPGQVKVTVIRETRAVNYAK